MSSDVTPHAVSWEHVLKGEHEAINQRRKRQTLQPVAASKTVARKAYGESGQFDTAGLALSGGGIRSAAFCLGAMQALAEHKVIDWIDYLSTVSGGGYTGTATTSAMSFNGGVFPFAGAANDMRDPRELGHIRDYSNYLIPRGKFSLLSDIAIVVRGLVTNALLVFPVILFAAAVTICLNPTREALSQPYFTNAYLRGQFAITIGIALFCLVMFSVWAIYRSVFKIGESEFGGLSIKAGAALLVLLSASAFCELQPVIINWMYDTAHANGGIENCGTPSPPVPSCLGGGPNNFRAWVTAIITYVTPLVAVVSLYAKRIGEILKTEANSDSYVAITKRIVGKFAIWGVALALPII